MIWLTSREFFLSPASDWIVCDVCPERHDWGVQAVMRRTSREPIFFQLDTVICRMDSESIPFLDSEEMVWINCFEKLLVYSMVFSYVLERSERDTP